MNVIVIKKIHTTKHLILHYKLRDYRDFKSHLLKYSTNQKTN